MNGEPVTEVLLRAGDWIRFGRVEARYEFDATDEAEALLAADVIEARPVGMSKKPADFANASPFSSRTEENDPVATACYAAAAVAIVALLPRVLNLLRLHAPL